MSELAARNMALLCDALDKENYQYFCTTEHLTSYMTCSARIRSPKLQPNVLRLTATPQDTGILFEASLPVPLRPESEEDLHNILLCIARENYSTIRGALAYRPASGLLYYRLFYALTEAASEFSAKEAFFCLKLCASSLFDSYPIIVRTLDGSRRRGDAEGSDASSDHVRSDLDALFDRLFGRGKTDAASPAEDAQEAGDAPEDAAAPDVPPDDADEAALADDDESSALDEELLSILGDILESDESSD